MKVGFKGVYISRTCFLGGIILTKPLLGVCALSFGLHVSIKVRAKSANREASVMQFQFVLFKKRFNFAFSYQFRNASDC